MHIIFKVANYHTNISKYSNIYKIASIQKTNRNKYEIKKEQLILQNPKLHLLKIKRKKNHIRQKIYSRNIFVKFKFHPNSHLWTEWKTGWFARNTKLPLPNRYRRPTSIVNTNSELTHFHLTNKGLKYREKEKNTWKNTDGEMYLLFALRVTCLCYGLTNIYLTYKCYKIY